MVPELVPVDRIVFLDSDVIVRTDVARLFDADLAGRTLGVVASGEVRHANDHALLTSLGMNEGAPYFNAAVLLVDAQRWRSHGYTRACLEFLRHHRRRRMTVDQTALNYVLRDDFRALDASYNVSVYPTDPALAADGRAAIFHLCGSPKPWDVLGRKLHGNYDLFAGLLAQTALAAQSAQGRFTPDRMVRTVLLGRSYWKNLSRRLRQALRGRAP
jgi:lipopolysaccharide biosynthesis glycosyltransferase